MKIFLICIKYWKCRESKVGDWFFLELIIYDLLGDPDYYSVASNDKMISEEGIVMWKEAVMVLSLHSLWGAEEDHEGLQLGYPVARPVFEPVSPEYKSVALPVVPVVPAFPSQGMSIQVAAREDATLIPVWLYYSCIYLAETAELIFVASARDEL